MALLGMPEAGTRLGVSGDSAKRALTNAGVPLVRINQKAWAVEEADLQAFIAARQEASYSGRGRPRKVSAAEGNAGGSKQVEAVKEGGDRGGTKTV